MAKHSYALRDIVAARGRVDPSALVLRVQGLRALRDLPRALQAAAARQDQSAQDILQDQDAGSAAAAAALLRSRQEASQMKFAYYPGCSARSTCAELNEATHLGRRQARA